MLFKNLKNKIVNGNFKFKSDIPIDVAYAESCLSKPRKAKTKTTVIPNHITDLTQYCESYFKLFNMYL